MLTELGTRIDEHSENFNKELKNIKKNQSELNYTITEIKNSLEGMNSRLGKFSAIISFYQAIITYIPTNQRQYKKRKRQANVFDEYRYKNPQQTISK